MKKIIRSGDVNLIEVEKVPEGAKKVKHNGNFVMAKGEATGSVHALVGTKVNDFEVSELNGERFFEIFAPSKATHSHDHETINVLPGVYKQVPEREVDHFAESIERKVID